MLIYYPSDTPYGHPVLILSVFYRVATYEVAGTATISLSCAASGTCKANSTDYDAKFVALDPVTDPTLAKYWVS